MVGVISCCQFLGMLKPRSRMCLERCWTMWARCPVKCQRHSARWRLAAHNSPRWPRRLQYVSDVLCCVVVVPFCFTFVPCTTSVYFPFWLLSHILSYSYVIPDAPVVFYRSCSVHFSFHICCQVFNKFSVFLACRLRINKRAIVVTLASSSASALFIYICTWLTLL